MDINDIIKDLEQKWSIMNNQYHKPEVRSVAENEYIRLCEDGRDTDRQRIMPYLKQYVTWKTNGG